MRTQNLEHRKDVRVHVRATGRWEKYVGVGMTEQGGLLPKHERCERGRDHLEDKRVCTGPTPRMIITEALLNIERRLASDDRA